MMTPWARRLLSLWLAAAIVTELHAADWNSNVQNGFAQARRTNKLVVLFFSNDEKAGHKRDGNRLDTDRQAIINLFRNDPQIAPLAQRNFVLIRGNFKILKKMPEFGGAGELDVWLMTAEGEVYEKIRRRIAIKGREEMLPKLRGAIDRHLLSHYQREVQPALMNSESRPAELMKALGHVTKLPLDAAAADVITVLDRPGIDAGVRVAALKALSAISSPEAVRALLDRAMDDPAAADALRRCKLRAASTLAGELRDDLSPRVLTAYRSAGAILKTNVRSEEALKNNRELAAREFARIRELARG